MIYPGLGYRWVFDQNWGIREQPIGVPTQTCGFNWTNRAVYSITNNNLMYNTTANQTKGAVVISVEQELGACVPQKTVFKQQTWEQKLGFGLTWSSTQFQNISNKLPRTLHVLKRNTAD